MSDWRNGIWAVIDTERTGLDLTADRICEVGIVTMQSGKTLSSWSSLVNPGMAMPPDATSVNGITTDMTLGAPTIQQLRIEITKRLAGVDAIVAYHGYASDFPWLEQELPGILPEGPTYVDPLVLIRRVLRALKGPGDKTVRCPIWGHDGEGFVARSPKHTGRHGLGVMVDYFDVFKDNPHRYSVLHRAEFDAECAGLVLHALRNECNPNGPAFERWARAEHIRQTNSLEKFFAGLRDQDAAKRSARQTFEERLTAMVGEHFAALSDRLDALGVRINALTPVIPATHTMVQIDGLSEIRPLGWDALRAERDALAKRVKEAEERSAEWAARLGAAAAAKVNEGGA